MRNLYWLVAMAIVIVSGSCSNDQELNNTQTKNKEIGFRSFIDKGTVTRATVTDHSNILGFTVTGWWDKSNSGNISNAQADEYMFNAMDITLRESGVGNWAYSPLRYWPASDIIGGGVSFFAYSPASSKSVTKGLYNYIGDKIEYEVKNPGRTEPQEDFLLARTAELDESSNGGAVSLEFVHALSRVRFFARTTNTNLTYVIGGVKMLGIAKKGEIDITGIPTNGVMSSKYNDTDPASQPVVLWENQSNKGEIGIDMGESPINLLGVTTNQSKYHSLQGETNALMVLPQTTALGDPAAPNPTAEFLIEVSYKAYLNNPGGPYFAGDKDNYKKIYFKVTDKLRSKNGNEVPFSFEIGRQYNFCIEFGSEAGEEITFSVNVGGWNNTTPEVDLP